MSIPRLPRINVAASKNKSAPARKSRVQEDEEDEEEEDEIPAAVMKSK